MYLQARDPPIKWSDQLGPYMNCGQGPEGTGIHSFLEALKEIRLYLVKTVDLDIKKGRAVVSWTPRQAAALRSGCWLRITPRWLELSHWRADCLGPFPHPLLAYQMIPLMWPLVCPTWLFWNQAFPYVQRSEVLTGGSSSMYWKGNAAEIAYLTSLRVGKSMLGEQRLARLWMNPPGVSAWLLALALSTSSRTPQRPNMAIPWPSYNGGARPRVSKHYGI